MKFTMLPEAWDHTVAEVEAQGHEFVAELGQAEFLIYTGGPADYPDLPANIGWVQFTFAGIDAIREAGKLVPGFRYANASGTYGMPVAESSLALLLAVLHQHKTVTLAKSFDSREEVLETTDWLHDGKTVALIGAGGIARDMIPMLKPFNPRIIAVNNSGREVAGADETYPMERAGEVFAEADIFVVLLPLTEQTHHFFNAELFARMKRGAVIINAGRGGLVNTDDLVSALKVGQLAGAGLDVTDPEPLPDGHPLWEMKNVVITPHTANTMERIRVAAGALTLENARAFEIGERMPHEVDPAAGY
ncbi:D-isomer specific 2-hydroxyacid dehydrogenase family protein [Corynebacterium sp. A21]|uniref:D-isomer specific 2-hydroxyacid dehydrogenase family protein n=1 Tax=Corynebacterium sp. A21 TaxID=3457318 RepID=UPI003FD19A3E